METSLAGVASDRTRCSDGALCCTGLICLVSLAPTNCASLFSEAAADGHGDAGPDVVEGLTITEKDADHCRSQAQSGSPTPFGSLNAEFSIKSS